MSQDTQNRYIILHINAVLGSNSNISQHWWRQSTWMYGIGCFSLPGIERKTVSPLSVLSLADTQKALLWPFAFLKIETPWKLWMSNCFTPYIPPGTFFYHLTPKTWLFERAKLMATDISLIYASDISTSSRQYIQMWVTVNLKTMVSLSDETTVKCLTHWSRNIQK